MRQRNSKSKGQKKLHNITDGTASASKALVSDSNKDLSGLRNLTITGTLTASGLSLGGSGSLGDIIVNSIKSGTFSTSTSSGTGTAGTSTNNGMTGLVQTTSMSSSGGGFTYILTVSNSQVTTSSVVHAQISSYGGAGIPVVTQCVAGSGSFTVTINNLHASNALTTSAIVSFIVIKG